MANLASYQKISRVLAARDFGDGVDLSYSSSSIPTITYRGVSGTNSSGSSTLNITSSGFANGDLILIHQSRGSGVGGWEINMISSGGGSTSLTLQSSLQNTYTDGGAGTANQAQVVKMPRYTSVTVGGSWYVTNWDGDVGGIFPIACNGTFTMSNNIVADYVGYCGGAGGSSQHDTGTQGEGAPGTGSKNVQSANGNAGGGGGEIHDNWEGGGGGGGGLGASGSNGYDNGGSEKGLGGSTDGSADLLDLVFGGAGGGGAAACNTGGAGGAGGDGGGIVVIYAKNIASPSGYLYNRGANGSNAQTSYAGGGGGGGAGGSTLLICQTGTLGTDKFVNTAGTGGDSWSGITPPDGGAGGVGRIACHHKETLGTSDTSPDYESVTDSSLLDGAVNYVKANIPGINTNTVKSHICYIQTKNFYTKAYIPTYQKANYATASIKLSPYRKVYDYRVYNNNVYVTTWSSDVISEPHFRSVVNGGPGEMVIKLDRSYDDFGEDIDVKLFNTVEVWCFDREAPSGVMIYSGYISGYRPIISGHSEYIEITILHQIAKMSQIMLRSGSGDTQVAMNSYDPTNMFKGVIDYYRSDGGIINYSSTSTTNTNTVVSYTFNAYTIKEALDKILELAPEDWYWRVDADNTARFSYYNIARATHILQISKNISQLETWRRAEDMVNRVYFIGQETADVPLYYMFENSGSVSAYGIHAIKFVDQRVTSSTTAETMANNLLNRKKDPEVRTLLTITDSNGYDASKGYDIESIKPGDSIQIRNLKQPSKTVTLWDVGKWDEDVWDQTLAYAAADILHIVSIEYTGTTLRIEASSRTPEVSKRIEDIKRNLEETQTWNVPATPST